MNPTEQRERSTQIQRLDNEINKLVEAFDAEIGDVITRCNANIEGAKAYTRELVAQEHTWSLQEEILQRNYVDRHLLTLRQDHNGFVNMTFWQRLRWVFTGKV